MKTTPKKNRIVGIATRFGSSFFALMLIVALLFSITACGTPTGEDENDSPETEQTVTVVIAKDEDLKEYTVDLSLLDEGAKALDVFLYLKENEGVELVYSNSTYGAYLTKVGNVEQKEADGIYVGLWTSYEADFDVSQYATTVKYGELTLTSSGVGVSEMSFENGTVIYIGEIKY